MPNLVATAETDIAADPHTVWTALTDPDQIEQYMFGSKVDTDWQVGSPITWSGEHEGKEYEDKGRIVEVAEDRRLVLTHFSPLSGQPDEPSSYHTLTYDLQAKDGKTHLSLSQDNNGDEDEAERSRQTWQSMLGQLKDLLEA